MRPSSRVENVGTCASNRVGWRHPRDWSGGGIVVGERRNAKGYLANKCPPSAAGQSCASPDMDTQSSSSSSMQCGCVAWILFKILIKTVLFSEAEGGDEGERGGWGCGHGQGAHIQLHARWFSFCIKEQ